MLSIEDLFKGRHFDREIIILCVRWYLRFKLSFRDLVEMMAERGGRDFAAWLGITPRQNSSGGKQTLGAITKQGNRYIRKLLVLGATSLLRVVGKRKGALRDWIVGLLAKKPARLVTVALANKLARIIWAMMKTGESFRTEMFAKA